MRGWLRGAMVTAALVLAGGTAEAACDPGKPVGEMTNDEAEAVYQCLKDDLHAGYKAGDKRWIPRSYVDDYRGWKRVSSLPANPGFHAERYLVTYVNDVGAAAYMKYAEDPVIPAGTLIAKESFSIDDKGKTRPGPLFLMEKVAEGKSPETNDWYYMMVAPNGAPQAVDVVTACSACHQGNFGHQGGLGYPVEEVRVTE